VIDPTLDAAARSVFDDARASAAARGDAVIAGEDLLAALFRRSEAARAALAAIDLEASRVADELLAQARPPRPTHGSAREGSAPLTAADAPPADVVDPSAAETFAGPSPDAPESAAETAPLDPQPTSQTRRLLALAGRVAASRGAAEVSDRDLLLAASLEPRGPFARVLNGAKATPFALRRAAVRVLDGDAAADALEDPAERRRSRDKAPGAPAADGSATGDMDATPVRAPRTDAADARADAVDAPAPVRPVPAASQTGSTNAAAPTPPSDVPARPRPADAPAPIRPQREPRTASADTAASDTGESAPRLSKRAQRAARRAEHDAALAADGAVPVKRGTGEPSARPERAEAARPKRDERGATADRRNRDEGREERGRRTDARPMQGTEAVGAGAAAPRTPSIGRIQPQAPEPLWRKVALLAVPASIGLSLSGVGSPLVLFIVTCVAVLPIASYMGEATEHLAARTNPTVGGLLNATFGNAAELIIAAVALHAGYVELVKASIIGSIIGNLLLILGLAIVAGGLDRPRVRFNRTGAGMSAGMLALAVVALVFPAILHAVRPDAAARAADELHLSESVAMILLVTYGLSLLFSLRTQQRLLGGEPHPMSGPVWPMSRALAVLGAATAIVAWESEILVHAVESVVTSVGIPEAFLGLIIVPLIGNAAEHSAAIGVARKGQMDLAFQIALGSSTQIALLVAPVLVFLGVAFGQRMDLVFAPFEVAALGLSALVASIVTLDGETHWFEGVQLLAVYLMVGAAAYFL
jgi:Ca2+:H+ antiporter